MYGERAGTRTQDLQIKSNFGRAESSAKTKPPVSREREIIRRIATFDDPGLETIGRDISMRWNAQRLQSLFTRQDDGWGARDCVTVGHPLFHVDGLKVTWARLPLGVCEQALKSRGIAGQARESREHMTMKRAAVLWMLHDGAKDASEEVYCLVGRADACSLKRNWIVECGKTGVSKLVTVVASGEPIRFSLIPFQDLTKRDGEPPQADRGGVLVDTRPDGGA